MRASIGSPRRPIASCDALEGVLVNHVVESSDMMTLRLPNEHASARNVPMPHARALFIYLRHRGVLNVEEFRRSNPPGR